MNPLLIILAILPGFLICFYIFKMDKYEKEPRLHLVLCFILGMLSTAPAIYLEKWGQSFGWDDPSHLGLTFLFSFIGIALVEELVKFVSVMIYPFHRPFFNEPMDGIVYAVMIGMGFATLENVYYAYSFGLQTTLVRAFTAVPAHATFAIIMGYYIGQSKFNLTKRIQFLATGFFLAVFFHGAYDFFLIQELYEGLSILAIVTLFLSIRYSKKLIRLHQENSPFKEEPMALDENEISL